MDFARTRRVELGPVPARKVPRPSSARVRRPPLPAPYPAAIVSAGSHVFAHTVPTRIQPRTTGPMVIRRELDVHGMSLPDLLKRYDGLFAGPRQAALVRGIKEMYGDKVTRAYEGPDDPATEAAWLEEKAKALAESKRTRKSPNAQPRARQTKEQPKELPVVVPKEFVPPEEQLRRRKAAAREKAMAIYDSSRHSAMGIHGVLDRIDDWALGTTEGRHDGLELSEHNLVADDYDELITRLNQKRPDTFGYFMEAQGSGKFSHVIQFKIFIHRGGSWNEKAPTFHIARGIRSGTLEWSSIYDALEEAGRLDALAGDRVLDQNYREGERLSLGKFAADEIKL